MLEWDSIDADDKADVYSISIIYITQLSACLASRKDISVENRLRDDYIYLGPRAAELLRKCLSQFKY